MARVVGIRCTIDFDGDGALEAGEIETGRVISASGNHAYTTAFAPLQSGAGVEDSCTLILNNADHRYDSLLTTATKYANTASGGLYQREMSVEVCEDTTAGTPAWTTIFRGVVASITETSVTLDGASRVTLDCRSVEDRLLNARTSTTRADFASYYDDGKNEAQLIKQWLLDAGASVAETQYINDAAGRTGLFNIPWAWLDDESPIEDIWQLAAACGGRFYYHPEGYYFYENAQYWLHSSLSSMETIDRSVHNGVEILWDDRDLYKEITVEIGMRRPEGSTVLWEPDELVQVPANSTKVVVARFDNPAYSVTGISYNAVSAGGLNLSASVAITPTYYAQRASLSIVNSHATYAATLRNLQITGEAVIGGPTAEENVTSAESFWTSRSPKTRALRGNPYIQTRQQAKSLAAMLLDLTELPRARFRLNNVRGKATRRLGQKITIGDSKIMSADKTAYIVGLSWRFDEATGWTQSIEAIDATAWFPYQASPGYFVLGNTPPTTGDTLGSAKVVFY